MSQKKEKFQEIHVKHPEVKGLLILSSCVALLVSLISFTQGDPSKNFLGLIGYWIALGSLWLFGLGAYFITMYATWIGWRLLYSERVPAFRIRTFYFFIFLLSNCLLLTVYAEAKGLTNPLLQSRVFSESITFKTPFLHKVIRHNLGGVPLYYLYKDLPLYSMMNLLSHIGTTLTFSITAFISFILLTGASILNTIKTMRKLYLGICSFFKRVVKGFQPFPLPGKEDSLSYNKMEEALSKPSIAATPVWNQKLSSPSDTYDYSYDEEDYGQEEEEIPILEEEEILPVKPKEPQKKNTT